LFCSVILLQFSSSDELLLKLANTGSDILVYAGEETPLGIDYQTTDYSTGWLDNENWLGTVLMSVREQLVKNLVTIFLLIILCMIIILLLE